MIFFLACLLGLTLAAPSRAATGWGDSPPLAVDTRDPVISLIEPVEGDTLRAGTPLRFAWILEEDSLSVGSWPPAPPIAVRLYDGEDLIDEWFPEPLPGSEYELEIAQIWSVHTFAARWLVSSVDHFGNAAADTSGIFAIFGSGNAAGDPVPRSMLLSQNHPNPFNPVTRIRFRLAAEARARLSIHEPTGRRIALLHDDRLPAGRHEIDWHAGDFGSGVYLAVLEAAGERQSIKLMLLK